MSNISAFSPLSLRLCGKTAFVFAFPFASSYICVESLRINLGVLGVCAKPPMDGGSIAFALHSAFAFSATTPYATAATSQTDDAADTTEPAAGFVSFRQQQPDFPRCNAMHLAPVSRFPACHFGDHRKSCGRMLCKLCNKKSTSKGIKRAPAVITYGLSLSTRASTSSRNGYVYTLLQVTTQSYSRSAASRLP